MEAAGFNDAIEKIGYVAKSMELLVGGPTDPNIPEWLRPKPVIFDIRDKTNAAAAQSADTAKTLGEFMGTTNTALASLQKGQQKAKGMFSRGFAALFRQIDDDSGRIDWKRVTLLTSGAAGLGATIHGVFTWIPKTIKALMVWLGTIHF